MIFAIIGQTLSGKTTLANSLSDELDVDIIVNSTDRPIRDGEEDGIDYHFLDVGDINHTNHLSIREFYTVYRQEPFTYGVKKDIKNLPNNEIHLITIDPKGYLELLENGINVYGVLLDIPERVILSRSIRRGDDINEVKRRLNVDRDDFNKVRDYVDLIYTKNSTAKKELYEIIKLSKHLEGLR